MKKRILSLLAAAAAVLCALSLLTVSASADRVYEDLLTNNGLYDPDSVFGDTDYEELNDLLLQTSNDINMYLAVIITGADAVAYSDPEIESKADTMYDQFFNAHSTHGTETDGLLLYLSLSTRYAYISTSGTAQIYYYNSGSDDRISSIISGMGSYLRNIDYAGAIRYFCSMLKEYKAAGAPEDAFTYNPGNGEYAYIKGGELVYADKLPWWFGVRWGTVLPLAGLIGLIAALVTGLTVRNKYKLKKSLEPTNYISQQDTEFFVNDDIFLREHVSKVHISSDSSRGGGGGGGGGFSHSSGGGFSHGGGGGHW